MSDRNSDVLSAFKEKKWGKDEDGEYITDGYSFRGKNTFQKALEGFKNMMKKGVIENVNDIKIQVLDTRKVGVCLDVEIECTEGDSRGIAMLKLYGPNKRKQNVITVSRSKGSDVKFVTILAEKVVRPLIEMFLLGKMNYINENKPIVMKSVSVRGKKVRLIKCPFCTKTSYSSRGLKTHITKMHKDQKNIKTDIQISSESKSIEKNFEEIIVEGADKVIKNLLEEIDDIKDNEEEMIEDETLEEICIDLTTPKKYYSECEKCGFISNASKRYETCKELLKHKENCTESKNNKSVSKRNCTMCKYVSSDATNLKKHMRDEHNITTFSISPPHKRPKKAQSEISVGVMGEENRGVIDLSESFEDMDIDETNVEFKNLSEAMDRKIIEKEKCNKEKEKRLFDRRKEAESKKEAEENQKRLNNKKRKQSLKDSRKANNKKNKKTEISDVKATNSEVTNIREIPKNCKNLVKDNDVLYVVPGNGACAPNCAAALLFGDEVFGPKLRGRMNKHLAKFFYSRYKNITQCSPGHPFVRKLAGGEVSFTNPDKLINFLTKSTDAELMWCDSEDLSVIADMYQIKIKVITSRGEKDENPTVNWIYPDESMKEHAELKKVELGELVLFHENDNHFNLVISKDSDLATLGSLSHRFKIGPKEPMDDEKNEIEIEKEDTKLDNTQIRDLEKELKKIREDHGKTKNDYIQCEKELRNKTEEVEILKLEINDLKELLKLKDKTIESDSAKEMRKCTKCDFKTNNTDWLRKHLENVHNNQNKNCTKSEFKTKRTESLKGHIDEQHESDKKGELEEIKKCSKCDFLTNSNVWMEKHMKLVHDKKQNDPEFNCNECDYQGTEKEQLNKHIFIKHTLEGRLQENKIVCNNCGEKFPAKMNLLSHRKSKHSETVAVCRKYLEGKCHFSPEKCWWNHKQMDEKNTDRVCCYICSDIFETKTKMMLHRKRNHKEQVSKCKNFLQNKCMFADPSCWFLHEDDDMKIEQSSTNENIEKIEKSEPVFQKVNSNIKPPISENLN